MKEQQFSGPGKIFQNEIVFVIMLFLQTSWSVMIFLLSSDITMIWYE